MIDYLKKDFKWSSEPDPRHMAKMLKDTALNIELRPMCRCTKRSHRRDGSLGDQITAARKYRVTFCFRCNGQIDQHTLRWCGLPSCVYMFERFRL